MCRSIAAFFLFLGCLFLLGCSRGSETETVSVGVVDAAVSASPPVDIEQVQPTVSLPAPQIDIATSSAETITPTTSTQPISPTVTLTAPPAITTTPTPPPLDTQPLANLDNGQAMQAFRIGDGSRKVVVASDNNEVAQILYEQFANDRNQVPDELTLWFVPNVNPSGATDVLRSADTGFDGCLRNDVREHPFDSAESRALRDFTENAALVLFIEPATSNVLHHDRCEQNMLASKLRHIADDQFLVSALPRSAGHFVDYLAGEGIAALTLGSPPDRLTLTLGLARALIEGLVPEMQADQTQVWLDDMSVEKWHLSADSFIHPLAIAELHGVLYLLDGGRVLAIDPNIPDSTLIPILVPGDSVEGVRVLEPLDITSSKEALYVLDRAGDVYRFMDGDWTLDRYDRPAGERSAHYFVALGADPDDTGRRHLLETSAPLLLRYADDEKNSTIPEEFYPVDVSIIHDTAYSLLHEKQSPSGVIIQHESGARRGRVGLNNPLIQPRQIAATHEHLFVLDRDGRRVQQFERKSGELIQIFRFDDNRLISAMYPSDSGLILAGRDAIYRLNSQEDRFLNTDHLLQFHQPHNPDVLKILANVDIPIGIPQITQRDFQMAGAPRHYRLGVHEGFDFYWQSGTEIRAAAAGTVIRADWQYVEPNYWDFEKWRTESETLGYTTEEGSDFFRGRQIWVDHGDGIVMRYVHLGAIAPAVQGGELVEQGQVIGYVGNTGSPASLQGANEDSHLHFEIRYNDGYIGQYIRPIEAREWIRKILR